MRAQRGEHSLCQRSALVPTVIPAVDAILAFRGAEIVGSKRQNVRFFCDFQARFSQVSGIVVYLRRTLKSTRVSFLGNQSCFCRVARDVHHPVACETFAGRDYRIPRGSSEVGLGKSGTKSRFREALQDITSTTPCPAMACASLQTSHCASFPH